MKLFFRIFLFSLLSTAISPGRISEIFNWCQWITRTEFIFVRKIKNKGTTCSYAQLVRKLKERDAASSQEQHFFVNYNFSIVNNICQVHINQMLKWSHFKILNIRMFYHSKHCPPEKEIHVLNIS